jgi:hypothetical protein
MALSGRMVPAILVCAMTCKRPCPALVVFAACFLTPAASGDEMNVLRVAIPSAFAQAPVGSFPLDDPNTDFLACQAQEFPQGNMWPWPASSSGEMSAQSMALTPPHAFTPGHLIVTRVIVPLRC